ncbi:hypothetical protein JOB18_002707 [Solea senegalensis]|uniref:Uncharacterized protein n=1 Tax=Solea senegalensis TaxID=28829 RepID=A0AAV6QB52_SOLSE|nr:hypothetical protein JOB18_002707 [Solea senegalensis]
MMMITENKDIVFLSSDKPLRIPAPPTTAQRTQPPLPGFGERRGSIGFGINFTAGITSANQEYSGSKNALLGSSPPVTVDGLWSWLRACRGAVGRTIECVLAHQRRLAARTPLSSLPEDPLAPQKQEMLHLPLSPASRHANPNMLGLSRLIQSMISERREPLLPPPPHHMPKTPPPFSLCLTAASTDFQGEEAAVGLQGCSAHTADELCLLLWGVGNVISIHVANPHPTHRYHRE